jgi:hypothetical protein
MRAAVSALLVLALATSAHAECAWVLWQTRAEFDHTLPLSKVEYTYSASGWQPVMAYDKMTACTEAQSQFQILIFKTLAERNENKAGKWETTLYRCLPDTVDPRGPKVELPKPEK